MRRRPPRSTRPYTLFPYTPLFRSRRRAEPHPAAPTAHPTRLAVPPAFAVPDAAAELCGHPTLSSAGDDEDFERLAARDAGFFRADNPDQAWRGRPGRRVRSAPFRLRPNAGTGREAPAATWIDRASSREKVCPY